ncbi:MAG TPA: hypothetical protein VKU80_05940 [Planctomycetota bacterium]|nr:hypothetical protein [Planctomycetota bacterium]
MMLSFVLIFLGMAPNDNPQVELASALARRGWVDLADELCERIGKMPGTSVVLAEVASARAGLETDAVNAVEVLDRAIARMGATLTIDERGMAGLLRVQKARLLGGGPEAAKAWQVAEDFYRASIAELQNQPAAPAVEEALLDARLELPKAIAARAREVLGDEALKKKLLDQALSLLLDFQFDTGARPIAFEAILEEGRVREDLRDFARAERRFRSVLEVKKHGAAPGTYLEALQESAFLHLLRLQRTAGKGREAIAAADEFLRETPRAKRALGTAVQLEKAEALAAVGDRAAAILLAQRIAGADPNGPAGRAARTRICDWTRNGCATASQLLLVADGLMERGLFWEALVDVRRCVEVCADAADRAKHEPIASFRRGECFRALRREAEASLAFQDVFRKYPKHELAQRAAFEAVRALIRSAAGTRDPRDEEQEEALLREIEERGLQGQFADYFMFLRAEILERKGKWSAAAELYQKVGEGCEIYDDALVSSGHCLRRDVDSKGDPKQLRTAERLLRRAVTRLEKSSHPRLLVAAQFELATVLLHDGLNKPQEALDFIVRCEVLLPTDSRMLSRLGEMEIRARLDTGDVAGASARLDRLLAGTDAGEIEAAARSIRRVAARMELTDAANAARYYRIWLDRTRTEDSSPGDVKAVADGLYRMARALSRLDAKVVSVLDLRGQPLAERAVWGDAAQAQERLAALPGLSDPERSSAESRVIWCWGLRAESPADWGRVKIHCDGLIQKYHLVTPEGLQGAVLQQQRWLAGIYLEYGNALYQLGKAGQKFQFGNALAVFRDLANQSERASEPWWICKAMIVQILFDRGEGNDLQVADAMTSLLAGNYPEFDEGRFGLKDLLANLRGKIQTALGPRRK